MWAKQKVHNAVILSERSSTALITTGTYGYYKIAEISSEYAASHAEMNIFQRILAPRAIIPIPSLGHASLILLAAHVVSSVDIACKNIAEDKKIANRRVWFPNTKAMFRAIFKKNPKAHHKKRNSALFDATKTLMRTNTEKLQQNLDSAKEFLRKQTIRTIPGLAVSALSAVVLGFAYTEGLKLYGIYRAAVLAKETIIDFSKIPNTNTATKTAHADTPAKSAAASSAASDTKDGAKEERKGSRLSVLSKRPLPPPPPPNQSKRAAT
jgi:hypothetical protein